MRDRTTIKTIANNKKARHDYFLENIIEAGISLAGTEVKSIRQGKVSIKESYCLIKKAEVYIYGMNITPYDHGNIFNHDPERDRKLLLHKKEIQTLHREVQQNRMTLVPLKVYLVRGRAKLLFGLARGKNKYDKRHALKDQQAKRDIDRALKIR